MAITVMLIRATPYATTDMLTDLHVLLELDANVEPEPNAIPLAPPSQLPLVKPEMEEPLKPIAKPESTIGVEITDTFVMPTEMDSISAFEILFALDKLPQDHLSCHALLELNADVEIPLRNARALFLFLLAIIQMHIKPTPLEPPVPLEPPAPLEPLDIPPHHHPTDVPITDLIATTTEP